MLPALYNPTIKQGVPFRRQLTITDDNGKPLDLTGATAAGNIRNGDGTIAASFAFDFTVPLEGQLEFTLLDTTLLPATNGVHSLPFDIFITPIDGDRICPLEGMIAVEAKQTELNP